jgi:hypothetical protein
MWVVTDWTKIYGTIFIDGEGLGDNTAHLRASWWTIHRKIGGLVGSPFKSDSICGDQAFTKTHLYTFRGLDGKYPGFKGSALILRPSYHPLGFL